MAEDDTPEPRVRRGRVLVLGGAGGMGRWFGAALERAGWGIDVVDPRVDEREPCAFKDLASTPTLDAYAAIVLATPLGTTADVLREVTARRPKGVVVEIASLKTPLVAALDDAEAAGVEVLSAHPMFGPSKPADEPWTFVLAERAGRAPGAEVARLAELLDSPNARIVGVPFRTHDELMAWLLGLAHLSGLLFATSLARSELPPELLEACASTTYHRQAASARSILAEDPGLYLDIQHLNPHRERMYRAVREALADLERVSAARDGAGFRQLVAEARAALGAEGAAPGTPNHSG